MADGVRRPRGEGVSALSTTRVSLTEHEGIARPCKAGAVREPIDNSDRNLSLHRSETVRLQLQSQKGRRCSKL